MSLVGARARVCDRAAADLISVPWFVQRGLPRSSPKNAAAPLYKNLPLETLAKKSFRQVSRTLKCDPKRFSTELKNTKIENFVGSHFGVRLTCRQMFPGSRFQWEIFYSVRNGSHPRPQFINALGLFRGGYRHLGLYMYADCSRLLETASSSTRALDDARVLFFLLSAWKYPV